MVNCGVPNHTVSSQLYSPDNGEVSYFPALLEFGLAQSVTWFTFLAYCYITNQHSYRCRHIVAWHEARLRRFSGSLFCSNSYKSKSGQSVE